MWERRKVEIWIGSHHKPELIAVDAEVYAGLIGVRALEVGRGRKKQTIYLLTHLPSGLQMDNVAGLYTDLGEAKRAAEFACSLLNDWMVRPGDPESEASAALGERIRNAMRERFPKALAFYELYLAPLKRSEPPTLTPWVNGFSSQVGRA